MKKAMLILFLIAPLSLAAQSKKFTPVYGNDSDINRTLSFVTENFMFDSLTYTRLQDMKGYTRCSFVVGKDGKIKDVKITKSLKYWLDYEIIKAMHSLPEMTPFRNKEGHTVEVKRDIYFTFNNSGKDNYFQRPGYNDNIQQDPSIEQQRNAQIAKNAEQLENWNKFTKDNTKISLDGKSVYKPGVLPNNPLKINTPVTKPPLTITINAD